MEMEKTLIINPGSSSRKYAIFESSLVREESFEDTIDESLDIFLKDEDKELIKKVAIRVVSPFAFFQDHKLIDDEYIKKLEENVDIAPLHIKPVLNEIRKAKDILPRAQIIAISDSAFHKSIPEEGYIYGISSELSNEKEVRRYGFHGISLSSVLRKVDTMTASLPGKIVICHLGSGVSVTAIKNGKSIDTSMGFSPLSGVIMNTRVGDIDPGALLYLLKKDNLLIEEVEEKLNNSSGLKAISGETGSVKELLSSESESAKLALKVFVQQVKKYIGEYITILGGLDWIIFTATISERAPIIREMILSDLEFLDIKIDKDLNHEIVEKIGFINRQDSKVKIAVIPTQEMQEMWQISKDF